MGIVYHTLQSKQQYQQLCQIPVKGQREFSYHLFPSVFIKSLNIQLQKFEICQYTKNHTFSVKQYFRLQMGLNYRVPKQIYKWNFERQW
ncbi:unnamed protein product [Paramecium pentaurelia]|uniref:Uncharacterized protein n=1 Tax=Paramecium pentaurelia TaxID=43138 RepID=A0A8S1YD55_9CILI|nr:unnamed protein product [Paramecium pentaurelia]